MTSNIQTSTVAELAAHPLKTFLDHGIRASINTDDPGVQGVDIIHEYNVAAPAAGLSREQIRQATDQWSGMGFSAEEKRALREKSQRSNKNGWCKSHHPFSRKAQSRAMFGGSDAQLNRHFITWIAWLAETGIHHRHLTHHE